MIDREGPRDVARARRLRDLLHDCVGSNATEQRLRLIEAAWLLPSSQGRHSLEAMIACEAYESAAALILGAERPYLVSRGSNGVCLASALIVNGCEEATAEAATPALAMLAAHVAALLAEETRLPLAMRHARPPVTARLH